MKVIGLMPVKNEDWILPYSLRALSDICDHIIVADHQSQDNTRQILRSFSKVDVIENKEPTHSNRIRWQLLDAARGYDGDNLILCVDADEIIPPNLWKQFITSSCSRFVSGAWLTFWWVQLWKSTTVYREDENIGSNSWKPIGFYDDRQATYDNRWVINDHTSRVPGPAHTPRICVKEAPLLHFQSVAWERNQTKQAWYACNELLHGQDSVWINERYANIKKNLSERLKPTPPEWFVELSIPPTLSETGPGWHLSEILAWFDQYGVERFEPLDIWHLASLRETFLKRAGREPRPTPQPSVARRFIMRATRKLRRML
jgi:glycosyltransferase involved in cell wall biosynthesis